MNVSHWKTSEPNKASAANFVRRLKEMGIHDEVVLLIRPRGVSLQDLISRNRHKNVSAARHEIMYWIRMKMKWSYPEIGKLFERDHTSVLSACRKMLRENPAFPLSAGQAPLSAGQAGGTGSTIGGAIPDSYDASDWIER